MAVPFGLLHEPDRRDRYANVLYLGVRTPDRVFRRKEVLEGQSLSEMSFQLPARQMLINRTGKDCGTIPAGTGVQ
ncbi:hypothetical protein [Brucella cytisi]|uniref:hypothetical protein n=1 Tax=Brucella cytisi TaxID=407152 RepID=UPI0035DB37B9